MEQSEVHPIFAVLDEYLACFENRWVGLRMLYRSKNGGSCGTTQYFKLFRFETDEKMIRLMGGDSFDLPNKSGVAVVPLEDELEMTAEQYLYDRETYTKMTLTRESDVKGDLILVNIFTTQGSNQTPISKLFNVIEERPEYLDYFITRINDC